MEVLKATQQQYEALNGYKNIVSRVEFIKDADGNWITNIENIDNPNFAEIKAELESMERITFKPIIEESGNE